MLSRNNVGMKIIIKIIIIKGNGTLLMDGESYLSDLLLEFNEKMGRGALT